MDKVYVARHKYGWKPDEIQEQLDYHTNDRLPKSLANIAKKPSNLSSLLRSAINYAGYLSVLEPSSPELKRALTIAANSAMSIFALADNSIAIEYDLWVGEGEAFSFPQTGPTSYGHSGTWQTGYYLALACREKHVLDSLVTKPTDIARQSSTIANEYEYLMIDALKSLYEPETPIAEVSEKLMAALRATDPDEVMEMTIDATLNIAVPEMEMIFRLLEGDSEAFNAALAKALELHKKHWSSTEQMSDDPRGFIAIAPLGIACYAYDAGFPIEVESEYIPKYILEKQFSAQQKAS
jgi:Immunity protein 49